MSIDTHVPGEPDQIRAAADWLKPSLRDGVSSASDEVHRANFSGSSAHWIGQSGESYRSVVGLLVNAGDDVEILCVDVAEKLRSYAGQLERMYDRFVELRDQASEELIPVHGEKIVEPATDVPYCPTSEDDPHWEAYQQHLDRIDTYNEIAEEVGTRWGELEAWIQENLTSFLAGLSTTPASTLLADLAASGTDVSGMGVEVGTTTWKNNVAALREHADQLEEEGREFKRQLKSGHPAIRAAAEAANPPEMIRSGKGLGQYADDLFKAGRALPIIGPALEGLGIISDLAQGDSPLGVAVEFAGGLIGGGLVVGGLALAGVTLPVWGGVIVVGAGALAVGAGAKWAYEEFVPQDTRERLDAGVKEIWDSGTDFVEDAWDWAFG